MKMDQIINRIHKWLGVFGVLTIIPVLSYSLLIFGRVFNDADGTWHGAISYAGGWELGEGRWLWPFLDKAKAYISPDPLSSICALIVFSAAYILIMELMEVDSRTEAVVSGLVFMISTPVCCCLSYRYMSHVFALAFAFSVLAAYCCFRVSKTIPGIILTAFCIALSMGLYQADLGCTVSIMVFMLIYKLWQGNETRREMMYIVRSVAGVLCGGIIYYLVWREELLRNDTSASSYGGADSVSIIGIIQHLPETIVRTVSCFVKYFGNNTVRITLLPRWLYFIVIIAFGLTSVYIIIKKTGSEKLSGVLIALLTILIPLLPMCTYMLSYSVSYMTPQMTVSLSLSFSLMLCMTLKYLRDPAGVSAINGKLPVAARITVLLLSLIILYGQHLMQQYDMYAMAMGRRSLETIASNVMDELITDGLYSPGIQYCFIGSPSDNPLYYKNDTFEKCNKYARYGDWGHVSNDNRLGWQGFFMNVMGVNLQIASNEEIDAFHHDERVEAMPVFPLKGSVALIDERVIIKLAE